MTLDDYMRLPWKTVVEQSELSDGTPCYVASNPELGSCIGQGDTPDEALDDLKSARRDLLTVLLEDGDEIPMPEPLPMIPQSLTHTGGYAQVTHIRVDGADR